MCVMFHVLITICNILGWPKPRNHGTQNPYLLPVTYEFFPYDLLKQNHFFK
jgi:hypothetical protein